MNYFKKIGSRSDEEQAMLNAIEQIIIEKNIPRNEIPECHSLDDLIEVKHLLDIYESNNIVRDQNEVKESEEKSVDSILHEDSTESNPQFVNSFEFDSDEEINQEDSIIQSQQIAEELQLEESTSDFDSGEYDPFSEQIIERSYNLEDNPGFEQQTEDEIDLEESNSPTPFDSPDARTKKKAAEQTANTILKGYARLVPKPFKWLAKISESRVEKLSFSGQLDVSIEVSDGVTFDEYMQKTNEQIDEIFEVDEDTLEEIKEPLVEVLLEQQMELTPQQRLGMAVLSHLMQMFTVAMKLRNQNNRILAYQKELTRMSQS